MINKTIHRKIANIYVNVALLTLLFCLSFFSSESYCFSENTTYSKKKELYSFSQLDQGNQLDQDNKQNSYLTFKSEAFENPAFLADDDDLAQEEPTNTFTPSSQNISSNIAQSNSPPSNTTQPAPPEETASQEVPQGPVINFNNVSIVEFLRFVSRLTGKNFIFDPDELQFPVTIISETPASIEDIMAALLQNLRIHDFYVIEEGGNFVLYKNTVIRAPGGLLHVNENGQEVPDIATQVFQVNNVLPQRIASIIQLMTSPDAVVEVIEDTSRVVVTDFTANINKIADIIKKLDAPNSGLEIGQYVSLNSSPTSLIITSQKILEPIAGDKPLVLVPYATSNSIYIVSTPFLVERALSVLQALDLNEGNSGILNLDEMKFDPEAARRAREQQLEQERAFEIPTKLTQDEIQSLTDDEIRALLKNMGYTDDQIEALFKDRNKLNQLLLSRGLTAAERKRLESQRKKLFESELPLGQVEATQFLIQKLQYRKSSDVSQALRAIADSLSGGGPTPGGAPERTPSTQSDLIITLNSIQTIDENNSLVFTGTRATLQKVKELVAQIDVPVRQVFIEALILDTTIQDSLHFGVEWAGEISRANFGAQVGLIGPNSTFLPTFQAVGMPNSIPTNPLTTLIPPPLQEGITASNIGRKIKFRGKGFRATGALINALRSDDDVNIVLNPKITTEHNVPAEIFVGQQIPIKGQSFVNSTNAAPTAVIATNYETQQTGVDLKVTPLISSSNTVTLIIEQKISNANQAQVAAQGQQNAPPATINETRTLTRVHMPSGYFLIMSGLIQDQSEEVDSEVPCLGAIPVIGYVFSNRTETISKRNLIMFIKPEIIDTNTDIEDISKREERIYREKCETNKGWRRDLNDLRKWFVIPETAPFTPPNK